LIALGIFYEVDFSFRKSGYLGIALILVGLDLIKGLADSMQIWRESYLYHLNLNYEGIPFRCG
jgi:hypothetical protein